MLKTSSVETITKYTQSLEGRTLVNFDEVPSSGKYDIADRMKSYITEPTFDCRSMYSQGYTQKNTFNVIITSNNNAINFTSSNNVRYASFDVSHHRKGDRVYFDKLIKAMLLSNSAKPLLNIDITINFFCFGMLPIIV